jgi:hypothetical protein
MYPNPKNQSYILSLAMRYSSFASTWVSYMTGGFLFFPAFPFLFFNFYLFIYGSAIKGRFWVPTLALGLRGGRVLLAICVFTLYSFPP